VLHAAIEAFTESSSAQVPHSTLLAACPEIGAVTGPTSVLLPRFPGDDIPIVRGSALAALKGENDALGKDKILELMQAVDDYVPTPKRALDKPFSMPVEDVFSIQVIPPELVGKISAPRRYLHTTPFQPGSSGHFTKVPFLYVTT